MGIEAELIPLDATTHRVAPLAQRVLPVVQRFAKAAGWEVSPSAKGAPKLLVPGGGSLTFEPGGQIEYATPPVTSPSVLLRHARAVLAPLVGFAADAGIELLGAGLDPYNGIEAVPLQIEADRYRCMDAYFASIGRAGARMMRQTASIQINVDPGEDAALTWRVLNAASPVLTAMFANSRRYAGADTGYASYRAQTWRELDPSRTGLAWREGDAVSGYVDFALGAAAMFVRSEDGAYLPFREWVARGAATAESTAAHMTTLFPDVRARGYFEVRAIDALPLEWYASPVLLLAGLALDARATREAAELLGAPDASLPAVAATRGMRDDTMAVTAATLVDIALAGCSRLGELCSDQDIELAADWFARFTRRGRSPADEPAPASIASAA